MSRRTPKERRERAEIRIEAVLRLITGRAVSVELPAPRLDPQAWVDEALADIERLTYRPPEE